MARARCSGAGPGARTAEKQDGSTLAPERSITWLCRSSAKMSGRPAGGLKPAGKRFSHAPGQIAARRSGADRSAHIKKGDWSGQAAVRRGAQTKTAAASRMLWGRISPRPQKRRGCAQAFSSLRPPPRGGGRKAGRPRSLWTPHGAGRTMGRTCVRHLPAPPDAARAGRCVAGFRDKNSARPLGPGAHGEAASPPPSSVPYTSKST